MIHDIPLMRSLDPHHSRLGYLGALSTVAVRTLDTYDALVSRLHDLLFERCYSDELCFERALAEAHPALRAELRRRSVRAPDEDPASILAPLTRSGGWLTRSERWLYDRHMPSQLGYLQPKHIGRAVDLARLTGVLLPTLDLSEDGFLLQHLVSGGTDVRNGDRNLLFVGARPALGLLYLRLLLRAEILFPSLLCEFVDRQSVGDPLATRGANGLLRKAVARLAASIGEPTDPEDVLAFSALREFESAIDKSLSTEENYLRPRLEMLVDLGIVRRRPGGTSDKPAAFPWDLPAHALTLGAAWRSLDKEPLCIDEFLDREFVKATAPAFGIQLRPSTGTEEVLLWFARGYAQIGREIGFTPGRTVAQLSSLLAAEDGVHLEVSDFFALVYSIPAGPFGSRFSLSGGSRFDSEFMVKLDLGLLPELERAVAAATNRGAP